MNWLAHLLLSEATPQFRIGNLLPDIVPSALLATLPQEYQRGAACHRKIDTFTDRHATVQGSVRRFPAPFRRYGGILTDIFYDHFLTLQWSAWSEQPLPEFLTDFYESLDASHRVLPGLARERLEPMRRENWLGSYGDLAGLGTTLGRVSRRLRRPFDLAAAVPVFEGNYDLFKADFATFFPELRSHILGSFTVNADLV